MNIQKQWATRSKAMWKPIFWIRTGEILLGMVKSYNSIDLGYSPWDHPVDKIHIYKMSVSYFNSVEPFSSPYFLIALALFGILINWTWFSNRSYHLYRFIFSYSLQNSIFVWFLTHSQANGVKFGAYLELYLWRKIVKLP